MAIVDTNNEGYLGKAKKQTESDRDYNGKINIEGRLYWISGYKRKRGDGTTFLKLIANPVEDYGEEDF